MSIQTSDMCLTSLTRLGTVMKGDWIKHQCQNTETQPTQVKNLLELFLCQFSQSAYLLQNHRVVFLFIQNKPLFLLLEMHDVVSRNLQEPWINVRCQIIASKKVIENKIKQISEPDLGSDQGKKKRLIKEEERDWRTAGARERDWGTLRATHCRTHV